MKNKNYGLLPGYVTKVAIFMTDIVFAVFSICLAKLVTANFALEEVKEYWQAVLVLIALRVIAFSLFRTSQIIIRYLGEKDYRNVFYAVTSASVLFLGLNILFPDITMGKNTVGVIFVDYLLLLLLSGGFRIMVRLVVDRLRSAEASKLNTAIFGAGEMGAMLEKVLRTNTSHNYRPILFFDDNPNIHSKFLNGIRIFNPKRAFSRTIDKYDIKVAIIAIGQLGEERRIQFINACLDHKIKVLKVPSTEYWIDTSLHLGQLEDIIFEDLLNRPPINLDKAGIKKAIRRKVIMVTGCAGSIGSEIVRQLLMYGPVKVIGLDIAETPLAELALNLENHIQEGTLEVIIGDVRDHDRMRRILDLHRPEFVFHAAAYKHVPIMEKHPGEAIRANILGTRNLADLSVEFGVRKFVMISTDKVVNPGNVMGASKRIAEIYVQALNHYSLNLRPTQFITTRFGNVLGSNGSVIPIFKKQIEERKDLTVTHPDVTRFFMTIPEACQLVLEASAMGNGGEIFIFDMGKPVRIYDLACKMIQMAGLTLGQDLNIVFSGLRPGEKLNEELLDQQENIIATHHPKIKKARVRPYNYQEIQQLTDELIQMANRGAPHKALVAKMKYIVPEFSSHNSIFSSLDRQDTNSVASPPGPNLLSPAEDSTADKFSGEVH